VISKLQSVIIRVSLKIYLADEKSKLDDNWLLVLSRVEDTLTNKPSDILCHGKAPRNIANKSNRITRAPREMRTALNKQSKNRAIGC
jgi:hypothetical protein